MAISFPAACGYEPCIGSNKTVPVPTEAEGNKPNEPLNVYIGAENPIGKSSGATLIISRFRSPYSDNSYIGVLGPTRQSYAKVMRLVRHTGAMLEEIL